MSEKNNSKGTVVIAVIMTVLIAAAIAFAFIMKNKMSRSDASENIQESSETVAENSSDGNKTDENADSEAQESSVPMQYDTPDLVHDNVAQSALNQNEDYISFIKNELAEEYSFCTLDYFAENSELDKSTLNGLIGAYAGDLDNDGSDELLTVRFVTDTYYDYEGEKIETNASILDVYSNKSGSVQLLDSISTTQFAMRSHMNIFHDNTNASGVEVFIKFVGDKKYICVENAQQFNMMDNSLVVMALENGRLSIKQQIAIYQADRGMDTVDLMSGETLYSYSFTQETAESDIRDFRQVHEEANAAMQQQIKQYGLDGGWLSQYYDDTQQNPLNAPISQFESNVLDIARLTEMRNFKDEISSGQIFDYSGLRDIAG